jgi:hypothetical protein
MKAVAYLIAVASLICGVLLDYSYARSTPAPERTQGTVVDFVRRNSRQVYPVFEFRDLDGKLHRVVNATQQAVVRLAAGDTVEIAYSRSDPERARVDTLWFDHRWMIAGLVVALTVFVGALRAGSTTDGR